MKTPRTENESVVIHRYVHEVSNSGSVSSEWDDGGKPLFARLIGAKTEEKAFVESTSTGLNIAANALHYPHGSKIVTTDLEYPSVVYPWLRKSLSQSSIREKCQWKDLAG